MWFNLECAPSASDQMEIVVIFLARITMWMKAKWNESEWKRTGLMGVSLVTNWMHSLCAKPLKELHAVDLGIVDIHHQWKMQLAPCVPTWHTCAYSLKKWVGSPRIRSLWNVNWSIWCTKIQRKINKEKPSCCNPGPRITLWKMLALVITKIARLCDWGKCQCWGMED